MVFSTSLAIQTIIYCGATRAIAENGIDVVDPNTLEIITTEVDTNPTLPTDTPDITTSV